MKKIISILFAFVIILSIGGCNSQNNNNKKKRLTVVVPVMIDAINDYLEGIKTNIDTNEISFNYYSAEGDPARFETVLKSALLNKPDVLVVFGTQMSELAVSSKFINDLPPTILSALSDPSKIESLKSIGIEPPRINNIGIVGDTPKKSYYVVSKELLQQSNCVIRKVGIIYTKSDLNAEITANTLSDELKSAGYETEMAIINNIEDISSVTKSLLLKGVDAMFLPHDKNVLVKAPVIVKLAFENKRPIPVFSLDEGTVREKGVIASASVSYKTVGKMTAKLASDYLINNIEFSKMPMSVAEKANIYINITNAKRFGISFPDSLLKGAIIYK